MQKSHRDTISDMAHCCNAPPAVDSLLQWRIAFARVVKSVDTADLKSAAHKKGVPVRFRPRAPVMDFERNVNQYRQPPYLLAC